jgi:hypothetical protein
VCQAGPIPRENTDTSVSDYDVVNEAPVTMGDEEVNQTN